MWNPYRKLEGVVHCETLDDTLNLYWGGEQELRQSLRLFVELIVRLGNQRDVTFIELDGLLVYGASGTSGIQASTIETFLDRAVPAVLGGAVPEGQLIVNGGVPYGFSCPQAHRNGLVSLRHAGGDGSWREVAVAAAGDIPSSVRFEFT